MRVLDINQCPDDYHTPNAFKNSHKCDRKTSYVSHPLIWKQNSANNLLFSVCSNPRPRLRERWLQVRVPARIRVSIRRSDNILRRPAGRVRIPEHHERQGDEIRLIQVPISRCRWNQGIANTHCWNLYSVYCSPTNQTIRFRVKISN
jgi:hypothetical protein